MNIDKEYAGLFELIAWLDKFKAEQDAQKTHQPTLTVVPQQAELPLQDATKTPRYRLNTSPKNFQRNYTSLDNKLIKTLIAANWSYQEIGEVMGRSGKAIDSQMQRIKAQS